MLKKWRNNKKSAKWGFALLALVMMFGAAFGVLNGRSTRAFEGDYWTTTDENGLGITVVSVEQNGVSLAPKDDGDGGYYFDVENNTNTVTVGLLVDGMQEGEAYYYYATEDYYTGRQELTAEDNGHVIHEEIKPYVYFQNENDCHGECWEDPLSGVYYLSASVYKVNGYGVGKNIIVRPSSIGSQNIDVLSIKQNDVEMALVNNEFQVTDYNVPVEVTFKFKNLNVGQRYSFSVGDEYESIEARSTEETLTRELRLNYVNRHIDSSIYLYGADYNDNEEVRLRFRVADADFVPLGDIVISDFIQGGNRKEPSLNDGGWAREFTLDANDVQPVTVRLHATRATREMNYYITYSGNGNGAYIHSSEPLAVTGEQLEFEGVDLVIPSGYGLRESSPISLEIRVDTIGSNYGYGSQTIVYENYGENHTSDRFYLNYFEDEELPRYSARMGYTNSDEEIYDVINAKYHDEDNPLWVEVRGERYDNETTYEVRARVNAGGQNIYNTPFTATGAELNEGKRFVLDGLVLSLPEFDPDARTSGYETYYDFSLEINGLTQSGTMYYMYDGTLYTVMTYPGGKVTASTAGGGMGGMYMTSSEITVRRSSLTGERQAVLHYLGGGFDDDLSYNYALYYNSNAGENWWSASAGMKVEEGVMTGATLNHDGLLVNVAVPDDASESSMYSLVITRNGGLVIVSKDFLRFTDAPMVESFAFHADSDSFMQTGRQDYRLARGVGAIATLTGAGFEDEQEYRIWVNYDGHHNEEEGWGYPVDLSDLNDDVVVTGAQLNAGYDYEIAYNQAMDEADNVEIIFNVSDKDHAKPDPYDWGDEGVYAGHAIYVDYVAEEDVFHGGGFQIDEETGEIIDVSQPDEPEELIIDNRTAGVAETHVEGETLTLVAGKPCVAIGANGDDYTKLAIMTSRDDDGIATNTYDVHGFNEVLIVLKGDLDMRGTVNARDSARIKYHILSSDNPNHRELSALELMIADVNNSNTVTARDAALIDYSILSVDNPNHRDLGW